MFKYVTTEEKMHLNMHRKQCKTSIIQLPENSLYLSNFLTEDDKYMLLERAHLCVQEFQEKHPYVKSLNTVMY